MKMSDPLTLPQLPFADGVFKDFMQKNNIPADAYNVDEIARFIRMNPRSPISQADLEKQLKASMEPVPWLPNFYKLNKEVSIAGCEAYKKGQIFGIDVSSGLVVHALGCQPGDNVLDVCCAPGSKFCFIADCMDHIGTLTGVDLSSARISICKTVIKKYFHLKGLDGCAARLFLTDGSTFSVLAPQSKFGSRKSSALTRGRKKEQSRVKEEEDRKQEGEDESGRRRKGVKANLQSDPDTKATQTSLATNDLPPITSPDMTQITTTQTTSTQNIISQTTTSETTTTSNPIPPPMQSPSSLISITNTLPSPPALPNPLPSLSEDMSPPPTQKKTKKRRKGRDKDLPDLYFSNDYSIRIPETGAVQLYDRILVDAECTLDASVRHLLIHSKKSPKLTTTPELTELQRRLITNAFQLLKPGGTMVYSTCSFCESQNEDIVRYLLEHFPSALVVPIPLPVATSPVPWSEGSLQHTVRLYPRHSGTSGMFIAKIIKLLPPS